MVEAAGEFLGAARDVRPAAEAEQADRDVAHGGHDLGGRAGPDLGAVFVEGDVADVVGAVLDPPVAADERGDVGGVGLAGGQAADPVGGFGPNRVAGQAEGFAVDPEGLGYGGEVEVGDVVGAGDGADLLPAVAAVNADVVRGGKTRPRRRTGP